MSFHAARHPKAEGTKPHSGPALPNRPGRRGISILELVISGVLLSTVMVSLIPMLRWVGAERRAADQRQFALQETMNVLERATLRSWEQITPELPGELSLSDAAKSRLRDAELTVAITEAGEVPPAKQISIELRWRNRAGDYLTPVRLTTWVYQDRESQP